MTTSTAPRGGGNLRRASALMASGSLVSRMFGIVRNAMLTMCLGGVIVFDTFNSANVLPNYIYILLAGGLLNAILIPQITKAMKAEDGGQAQIDRLLTLILLVVGVVGVGVALLARPIIDAVTDYQGSAFDLAVAFGALTMPQVLFYCLYVLFGQVLNARGQFAAFMWAPVLANVVQIAGMAAWLLQFRDVSGYKENPAAWTSSMVWWLAGTSTLGIAVQALVLVVPLWRGGFRYRPRFDFRGHGLRQAGTMVGWAFAALVVSQAGGLFAQWVLTHVVREKSGLAGYGVYTAMFTIFMIPHSLVTTTIVTALFPRLSSAVHDRDRQGQRDILYRCLTTPAAGVIPLSLAVVALAVPGIRVLNPGFSPSIVRDAAAVLAVMTLGMWAFGVKTIQERYTFAREDGRATVGYQLLVSGIAVLFSVAALFTPSSVAALVIATGMTVSNIVGATVFVVAAERGLGGIRLAHVAVLWLRLLTASIVPAVLAWGIATFVVEWLGGGLVLSLVALALGGTAFVVAFLVIAVAMNIAEVAELLLPVVRRLRRAVEGPRSA